MTLQESVDYHCGELINETEDYIDALQYVDDVLADVLEEHPTADQNEVEEMIKEKLKDLAS